MPIQNADLVQHVILTRGIDLLPTLEGGGWCPPDDARWCPPGGPGAEPTGGGVWGQSPQKHI